MMSFDGRLLSNIGILSAVVDGGSFARAADALGLTPSGVSRAIARLEGRIGVRLFDRTTRSMSLTGEGRRLYEEIRPLAAGIEDAVAMASGAAVAVRGNLRINVDAFFARTVLAPQLGRFLERHPEITLDLVARDQLGDLVADGFDVAVRFGEPPSSSLVARRLMRTRVLTVATPGYLSHHGRPASPEELPAHACLQMRDTLTGEPLAWRYRRGRRTIEVPTAGRVRFNEGGALLAACLAGVGIARIKAPGIREALEQGQLVDLFPDWTDDTYSLYALYPSRHLPAAKVRAFVDFVLEICA